LSAIRTEDAGHPDFFTNNTFHFFLKIYAIGYEISSRHTVLVLQHRSTTSIPRLQPTFSLRFPFLPPCAGQE